MQEQATLESIAHKHCCSRMLSWTAVLIGGLIGIGLSFLFSLFGAALGLTAFLNPSVGNTTFAIGGFLGLLIIAIFTMGVAGWVAGFLAKPKCTNHNMGVLYGFSAWCISLILLILLSSLISQFIQSTTIHIVNPAAMVASSESKPAITTENQKQNANQIQSANLTTEQTKGIAMTTFVTFLLFFLGALASCLGGHWGFNSGVRGYLTQCDPLERR